MKLLHVAVLIAATSAVAADDGDLRVYTNADLAALPEMKTQSPPETPGADLGWVFVQDFLDREHARIDAERTHDLERRRVVLDEDTLSSPEPRYVLPYGYYGSRYGNRRGGHQGRVTPPSQSERVRQAHRQLQNPRRPIVPLHGRIRLD